MLSHWLTLTRSRRSKYRPRMIHIWSRKKQVHWIESSLHPAFNAATSQIANWSLQTLAGQLSRTKVKSGLRIWKKFYRKSHFSKRKWTLTMSRIAWALTIKSICQSIAHSTLTQTQAICTCKASWHLTIAATALNIVSGVKRHRTISRCLSLTLHMQWVEISLWGSRCLKKTLSVYFAWKAWPRLRIGPRQLPLGFRTRSMALKPRRSTTNARQWPSTSTTSLECICWLSTTRRGMKLSLCSESI